MQRGTWWTAAGVFCVGYTLGTGGVAKLGAAGVEYGLFAWAPLILGALLFWTLLEASGRFALTTRKTALHGFRTYLPGGRVIALIVLVGVALAQVTGLPVLVNLVAQLLHAALRPFAPALLENIYGTTLGIAAILLSAVWLLSSIGNFALVERTMVGLVGVLGLGSLVALTILLATRQKSAPLYDPITPSIAGIDVPWLALVGIALAAPTFLLFPLLLRFIPKTVNDGLTNHADTKIAALILLGLTATIVAIAGMSVPRGQAVSDLFSLLYGIEATAGRGAAGWLLLAALGAGLSSLIPMVMILPLMIADYHHGALEYDTFLFRWLTAVTCVVGLAGSIWVESILTLHRMASQMAQIFVLPLIVFGLVLLLNRSDIMRAHKAGIGMNMCLLVALGISLLLSWQGLIALGRLFI